MEVNIKAIYKEDKLDGIFAALTRKGFDILDSSIFVSSSSPIKEGKIEYALKSESFFYTIANPPYLGFDFRNNLLSLTGYTIKGISTPYPTEFQINVSNDGISWDMVHKKSPGATLQDNALYYDVHYSHPIRYFKVIGLADSRPDSELSFGIRQIELFGILKPMFSFFGRSCAKRNNNFTYLTISLFNLLLR